MSTTSTSIPTIHGTVEVDLHDLISGDVGMFDATVFERLLEQDLIDAEDVPGGETPYILRSKVVDHTEKTVILDVEVSGIGVVTTGLL